MYERNVIVIEKYIDNILGMNKQSNVKVNYENYKNLIGDVENFESISNDEKNIIEEFDNCVKEIEIIQKKQEKFIQINKKMEETRNSFFYDLGEETSNLENKFEKVESTLEKNNIELKELREKYLEYAKIFSEKQKERNKCEKVKRLGESNHITFIKKAVEQFNQIEIQDLKDLKTFLFSEKDETKNEIFELVIKNGKKEKVKFSENVVKKVIDVRISILEKELEIYLIAYDKMKKLLSEIEDEKLKLDKHKKTLRDLSIKLKFLELEKEYMASFLDYERLSSMSGLNVHEKLMKEACETFEDDIKQIDNLYQLILKEITNKSSKKAYNELYNKTYLQDIEEKEKHFEKEANNIKTNVATVINSSYWRIESIKNIYNTFIEEVTEKFNKDLTEYRTDIVEEIFLEEEISVDKNIKEENKKEKVKNNKEVIKEEFIFDENEEEYDEDDELDIEEDELDIEEDEFEEEEFEEEEDDELDIEEEEEDELDLEEDEQEEEEDEEDDDMDLDRIFQKNDKDEEEEYEEDEDEEDEYEEEEDEEDKYRIVEENKKIEDDDEKEAEEKIEKPKKAKDKKTFKGLFGKRKNK